MTSRLPRVSKVLGGACILIGGIVLLGWATGWTVTAHPLGGVVMKGNAALAVMLAGASLWALAGGRPRSGRHRLGQGLAGLVTAVGALTLLQYVTGLDVGIDQLLLREPPTSPGGLRPGRMAPNTAAAFLFLGASLLLVDCRTRTGRGLADGLALTTLLVGLLACTDFLYRAVGSDTVEIYRQMSLFTAVSLTLLSVGVLLARPLDGLTGMIVTEPIGGAIARRLLPAILLVPPALGWLRLRGEHAGLYDTEFGAAIMVLTTVALLAAIVLWTAASLNRADRARKAFESERLRMDDQLRRTSTLLDAIVENLPLMVFVKDAAELRFVRFNRAGEQLLGLTRADLLGKNDYDLFPAEQAAHFQAKDRETLAGSGVVDLEEPIDSPTGKRWLHTKKVTIARPDGAPAFLLGISEDISQRRQKDQELQRWAHVFQNAHWGIAITSPDGLTLERMNDAFAQMHGYALEELVGSPTLELIAPGDRKLALEHIAEADRLGKRTFQILRRRKDGSTFPALVGVSTVKDAEGHLMFRAANVQDITSIKEAEEELRRAKNAAEATSHELESFGYSVSHDLRAPLRTIDGFSQALLEDHGDQLNEEAREHLGRVRGAAQRMAQLIDDLLELSRVTRAEMERKPVDLTAVARDVAAGLARSEPERSARFQITEGLTALSDPRLVRVLLENLLGNAWKFTSRRPTATIEVGQAGDEAGGHFFVRDDGAGFDMSYADKLFGAFQRLHRETEFEGTGIGLATVHRIVLRHAGRIWAEGQVDKGATFRFTLAP